MLGELSEEGVGAGIIDVDVVVVGSNCELAAIWGVLEYLNPLLRVSLGGQDCVELGS